MRSAPHVVSHLYTNTHTYSSDSGDVSGSREKSAPKIAQYTSTIAKNIVLCCMDVCIYVVCSMEHVGRGELKSLLKLYIVDACQATQDVTRWFEHRMRSCVSIRCVVSDAIAGEGRSAKARLTDKMLCALRTKKVK